MIIVMALDRFIEATLRITACMALSWLLWCWGRATGELVRWAFSHWSRAMANLAAVR